jgi:hypothetical protein
VVSRYVLHLQKDEFRLVRYQFRYIYMLLISDHVDVSEVHIASIIRAMNKPHAES